MKNRIKCIVVIMLLFVLSGCGLKYNNNIDSIVYNLDIGKTFKENIIFTFPISDSKITSDDLDNYYSYKLIHEDLYPIDGNPNYKYSRKINKGNDKLEVLLSFEYLESEFDYSNYATQCFENYDMITDENYFEVTLSGEFYCWNNQNVEINITSNYYSLDVNGENIGNSYVWYINSNNYKNVDIHYKVSRKYDEQLIKRESNNIFSNIKYIVGIIIVLFLFVYLYKFYKKRKLEFEV